MNKEVIKTEINVVNNKIGVMRVENVDYISITDLAKYANANDPSGIIRNWMSNKNSFTFYSLWEELNNENFIPWNRTELKLMKHHITDLL